MVHVDREELAASVILLKCIIRVAGPLEQLEQAHGNGSLLLQVYCLADKWRRDSVVSRACMAMILTALSAVKAEDLDLATLSAVYSLPAGLRAAPSLQHFLATCHSKRATLFRDVPAVIGDPTLLRHFCTLPHEEVFAWLQADNLKVCPRAE